MADMPDLKTMQREMQNCRQEIPQPDDHGYEAGPTPEKKARLLDLERSARAKLKLRHKAMEYCLSQSG
jgi:hypothetical protein